jgi:hypothetical protein
LSLGYLDDEVREPVRVPSPHVLFDTQGANFVRKIDQDSCIDNFLDGPFAVDTRRDKLVLSLEPLGAHGVQKASNFFLVCERPIFLSASEHLVYEGHPYDLIHLISTTMAEIEIGFVSGLEAEDSVAENLLSPLYDVQTPIDTIIEWNPLEVRVSTGCISEWRRQLRTNQDTNRH